MTKKTKVMKIASEEVKWRKVTIAVVLSWLLAQMAVIAWFWDVEQHYDMGAYISYATKIYRRGTWYPDHVTVHSNYLWAPGLINWLVLQLRVFGTLKLNYFFNLLMNAGILYEIWLLSKHFFSRRTGYIAVILYCLLYSNIMVVLLAGTEIPFLFLSLTAFCLCVSGMVRKPALPRFLLAGCCLATANWFRPLVVFFALAILVAMWLHRCRFVHYVALTVPVVLLCLLFGLMAKRQCGLFAFQSSTSGVNLLMTANDKAFGGNIPSFLSDTTSFLKDADKMTFLQKDSAWKAMAIGWIKEHPARYAGLYVLKLGILYIADYWAERPVIGGDGFLDKFAHGKATKSDAVKRVFNMAGKSLVYYAVCVIFLISLVRLRKDILTEKGIFLLIVFVGTFATCVFATGTRYHYPFMFAIVIWAAYGIDRYLQHRKEKDGKTGEVTLRPSPQ